MNGAGRSLASLPRRPVPRFPGWAAALGPGVVWMALAQGSGELIWWPYIVAKYGLAFLVVLAPACLLQYPLTVEIGRYTLATGESIFHGFIRLHRGFGIFLWLLMSLSFLWFGAFASAGGTALAALTDFPAGWDARGQSLFWGYVSIAVSVVAIVLSPVVYLLIEWFMKVVAVVTLVGLAWACAQPDVLRVLPAFSAALVGAGGEPVRPWDPADATKLLTAITFAGLGGFWILFYSYWMRDKGSGMAAHNGRIMGVTSRREETTTIDGVLPLDTEADARQWRRWERYLRADVLIGILGNLATTLMTCLLAYALLLPKGLLPKDYELAVVQSEFFAASLGEIGRIVFLVISAAFLADTWLATVDAVARTQSDIVHVLFPRARAFSQRQWYFAFLALLTVVTCITMAFDQPGQLILLSAVIGFVGTVMFPVALYLLNYRLLPSALPKWAHPARLGAWGLGVSFVAYLCLAGLYLSSFL
jgi:hypothetical protein